MTKNKNKVETIKPAKAPTVQEMRVQLYKTSFIQQIQLKPEDKHYKEGEANLMPVDLMLMYNGTVLDVINFIGNKYPNSIILKMEIYEPNKTPGGNN